ncbi:MAG: type IV pilus modification protein PilV [Granulosicoccus sp.]
MRNFYPKNIPCAQHTESGVGLVEILIAVILVSIGFLAAAKMQIEGMRFSQSAYNQSQAYFLASDMLDRMRANYKAVDNGLYDNIETSTSATNPGCDTPSNFCTRAEIAEQDLYDWSKQLHPLGSVTNFVPALPGTALGRVTPVAGTAGLYIVHLEWTELIDDQETTEELNVNIVIQMNDN